MFDNLFKKLYYIKKGGLMFEVAIIGGGVYLLIGYKMNLFQDIFGKQYINKLIKKLTFGKVSLGD